MFGLRSDKQIVNCAKLIAQKFTIKNSFCDSMINDNRLGEKYSEFDALVLIHPTYNLLGRPGYYFSNIAEAVQYFRDNCKPVVAVKCERVCEGIGECGESNPGIHLLTKIPKTWKCQQYKSLTAIIDSVPGLPEEYAAQIEKISKFVGKSPDRIHLALGGMYADACVFTHAFAWCTIIEASYAPLPDELEEVPISETPLWRGKIIEDIVVYSSVCRIKNTTK